MFSLRSENLTGLGGPMGTERTWTNWVRYFSSLEKAKAFAEQDYNNSRGPIEWHDEGRGKVSSQDLGYVMYHIRPVKVTE